MKTFAFLRANPLCKEYRKMGVQGLSCGRYNGYVGIIDGDSVPLSYQGENSNGLPLDDMVFVLGGITFDGKFGRAVDIIPLTEIPADWWEYRIIGFDCAHWKDTEENCPFEFVREEAMRLREQIERLIKLR